MGYADVEELVSSGPTQRVHYFIGVTVAIVGASREQIRERVSGD